MAHISGFVATGVLPPPFAHANIVTTTTHKSPRGSRSATIFYRNGARRVAKGEKEHLKLEKIINISVFPSHQGDPPNQIITALALALRQARTPEFKAYQQQVFLIQSHSRMDWAGLSLHRHVTAILVLRYISIKSVYVCNNIDSYSGLTSTVRI